MEQQKRNLSVATPSSLPPRESDRAQLGVSASRAFCSDAVMPCQKQILLYTWSHPFIYHGRLSLLEQILLSHCLHSRLLFSCTNVL